jgi:micrococcal nuclease
MNYKYNVRLRRVVDGDTVDFDVDLGFRVWSIQRFRLARVDTPEIRTKDKEEKERGKASKEFVRKRLTYAESIQVETVKTGKFGRWLAEIWYVHKGIEINLNDELLHEGLAEPYE